MRHHLNAAPYADRDAAALRLLELLTDVKGRRPVVLGIPRGAVPMARLIAAGLGGELDLALAKKIGHPRDPEFALGAVTEDGELILGPAARGGEFAADDLERMALDQVERLRSRRERLTGGLPPVHVEGRVVVLVDDGIATGATMSAAVRALRNRGARRVIVTAPVASRAAVSWLAAEGADVRVPLVPEDFTAVSSYYQAFAPVTDDEVHACFLD